MPTYNRFQKLITECDEFIRTTITLIIRVYVYVHAYTASSGGIWLVVVLLNIDIHCFQKCEACNSYMDCSFCHLSV